MISRWLVLSFVMLLTLAEAWACVGCREPGSDTVANEPQTMLAGFGFSWGVLIMLGCALAVVGSLVGYICATIRRLDRTTPQR
jgi:hypothetical protein